MPHAAVAAEAHRNRDTILEDALDGLPPDHKGTLAEIAQKVGLVSVQDVSASLPMREVKRLAAALQARGWDVNQVKVEGVNRRVWSNTER